MKKNTRHLSPLPIYFIENIRKQSSFPWFNLIACIAFIVSLNSQISYFPDEQLSSHFQQLLSFFDVTITFNVKVYNLGLFSLTTSNLELLNDTREIIEIAMKKNILFNDLMSTLNHSDICILERSILSSFHKIISEQNCDFNNLLSDLEAQISYLSK